MNSIKYLEDMSTYIITVDINDIFPSGCTVNIELSNNSLFQLEQIDYNKFRVDTNILDDINKLVSVKFTITNNGGYSSDYYEWWIIKSKTPDYKKKNDIIVY